MDKGLAVLFGAFFGFIPGWITIINRSRLPNIIKKAIAILLVIFYIIIFFDALIMLKYVPVATEIIKILVTMHFALVIVVAYVTWPRKTKLKPIRLSKIFRKAKKKAEEYLTIPELSGTHGAVSVTLLNSTYRSKDGQALRFVDGGFGSWLIEEIINSRQFFATKGNGSAFLCPACGAELNEMAVLAQKIEYQLAYQDFPPFIVQIVIPSIDCSGCGRRSAMDAYGNTGSDLQDALIEAFKSRGIKP